MKIFYYCQTGKYASLLAGALHLQKLNRDLTYKEFLDYIRSVNIRLYNPLFLGEDCHGSKIYVLSTKIEGKLVATILDSFISTFTKENQKTYIIDSLPRANLFLMCVLKLNTISFLKSMLKSIIPFAVWINRKHVLIFNSNSL